jgi:uncharacterized protein with GYD domain
MHWSDPMPTYLATIRFTPQGLSSIRDTVKRANSFKSAAKKMGVKVTNVYWTLGRYDGLLIMDAPDEQTVTAAMLQLGTLGNVSTQTARAFTTDEISEVLARMSR